MPLYDENAEVIPGTENLNPEDIKGKDIKKILEENESNKKKYEEMKKELGKLQKKDYNFKKLRDMTDDEREKLSAKELQLLKGMEDLEKRQGDFEKKMKSTWKESAFNKICGEDKKLREKVELAYNEKLQSVKPASEEEYFNKIKDAYVIATGQHPNIGSTGAEFSSSGAGGVTPPKNKKQTKEDEAFDRKLGIKPDDEQKKAEEQRKKEEGGDKGDKE